MMSKTLVATVASSMILGGCAGAVWGNLLVLGITVGIFVGTLSLGRVRSSEATRSAERSSPAASSRS